jgi:site-specific DNA-cytosine methylase
MNTTEPQIAYSECYALPLVHGSLFSGIGGFELGAEWSGIPTLWSCEIEQFQRSI